MSDRANPNPNAQTSVISQAAAAIAAKRATLPWLGQPVGDVMGGADTKHDQGYGFFRHFEAGSIFWSSTFGAHEVHGAIRDKYASLGWEKSYLGYPETDELSQPHPGVEYRYNNFEEGTIGWTADSGIAFIEPSLSAAYPGNDEGYDLTVKGSGFAPGETVYLCVAELEGATGCLGVGDGYADSNGQFTAFEYTRFWSQDSGMATLVATGTSSGISASTPVASMY